MSKTVELVVQYLKNAVSASVPLIKESPFQYTADNNSSVDRFVYAVRAGSLSASSQRAHEMDVSQNFEIELIKSFKEVGNGDKEVTQSIYDLYDHHEQIFQKIALRNSHDFRISNIPEFSASAPVVDRTKKAVSLTYNYRIHYRRLLKGA